MVALVAEVTTRVHALDGSDLDAAAARHGTLKEIRAVIIRLVLCFFMKFKRKR